MNGTVVRMVSDKGFGFILPEGSRKGQNEHFFHKSGCLDWDKMREGVAVRFETTKGEKGPRAEAVEYAG